MKRSIILGSLLVAGMMSLTAAGQQAQAPRVVEAEKIKDNLYVLRGEQRCVHYFERRRGCRFEESGMGKTTSRQDS
jgi:hypothetical protein